MFRPVLFYVHFEALVCPASAAAAAQLRFK